VELQLVAAEAAGGAVLSRAPVVASTRAVVAARVVRLAGVKAILRVLIVNSSMAWNRPLMIRTGKGATWLYG